MSQHHVELKSRDLTAIVGDNSAHDNHAAGYNGLWSLTHRSEPQNIFVPTYAGVNLEHVLNGETANQRESFFEPRLSPMKLNVVSETEAELYQPPTPLTRVESWTRFALAEPDILDFQFRAVPHADCFPMGYLAFFWASYIHGPEDKSMYFMGGDRDAEDQRFWRQLCTQAHGTESTVGARGVQTILPNRTAIPRALMQAASPQVWAEPFFYGRFRSCTFLAMFDLGNEFRLSHSPTGGGASASEKTSNPAWDFQFVVDGPRVGNEYGFRARFIYRPAMTREQVLNELGSFKAIK